VTDLEALDFLDRQFYLFPRILPNGRWAAVQVLLLGQGRITEGSIEGITGGYDRGWCYETLAGALTAMMEWDSESGVEPGGWVRAFGGCRGTRRRTFGDSEKEYVDAED
jgi:hypothetical protein